MTTFSHDTFVSPLTWRYGSVEMRQLWSETHKRKLLRRVWFALAKAQHEVGLVTTEQLNDLYDKIDQVDIDRATEIEKDIKLTLVNLGLSEELNRISVVSIRSGKPRLRGRYKKIKKGPLIVCSKDSGLRNACKNLTGVDLVEAKNLAVTDVAPGTESGRLVIWTKSSFSNFSDNVKKLVEINAS